MVGKKDGAFGDLEAIIGSLESVIQDNKKIVSSIGRVLAGTVISSDEVSIDLIESMKDRDWYDLKSFVSSLLSEGIGGNAAMVVEKFRSVLEFLLVADKVEFRSQLLFVLGITSRLNEVDDYFKKFSLMRYNFGIELNPFLRRVVAVWFQASMVGINLPNDYFPDPLDVPFEKDFPFEEIQKEITERQSVLYSLSSQIREKLKG